jgi:hypothetical protein
MGKAATDPCSHFAFKARGRPEPGFARDFKAKLAFPVATELHLVPAFPMISGETIAQGARSVNLGPEQAARGKDLY